MPMFNAAELISTAGVKLLSAFIIIFFCLFAFLCWHWSSKNDKKERMIISLMVPLIYSFKILVIASVFLGVIYLLLEYTKGLQLPSF